jgi:hypothetical protein
MPQSRTAATLWLVAALLAWSAVAIGFTRRGEMSWSLAAAGLFCAVIGVASWTRTGKA